MKEQICDLHTHSLYSDGTYSPTELIKEAEILGLSAIALCDHNTTGGLLEFIRAADGKKVEAVAGVEFSTDYKDTELHVIALFVNEKHFARIEELVREMKIRKEKSNDELYAALCAKGYTFDYEAAKATCGGQINRAHIAEALVKEGYFTSIKEAFSKVLVQSAGFYKRPKRLPVFETIEFIKSIGAVAILAHPFLNLDEDSLNVFLEEATKHGLDAMETEYSTYNIETTKKAKATAKKFNLLESGGSDFHGARKPDIALGVGKGNLAISALTLEKLKKRAVSI